MFELFILFYAFDGQGVSSSNFVQERSTFWAFVFLSVATEDLTFCKQ